MSVYFIRVGRYFKVGFSDDPVRRFERLDRSGTRYTFPADAPIEERELYKVVPGCKSAEHRVLIALDQFSVGLEWFLDAPEVRAFIDGLSESEEPEGLTSVHRPGGWCEDEYRAVQVGRGEREVARFLAARGKKAS